MPTYPTLIFEVYRWSGTTPEDFERHYCEVHAKLGMKLPGVRWYESFLTTDPHRDWPIQEGRARPDAFVILQFESEQAIADLRGTQEWKDAKLDDWGFVGNSVSHPVRRFTWIPDPEVQQPFHEADAE